MGFFEKFRKPKAETAAAIVAGTISAVAPAAAAEMPQQVDAPKTTIERVTSAVAPGLAKIQMEDGRTATLNVPSGSVLKNVPITPGAFQPRELNPEIAPAPAAAIQAPEYTNKTREEVIESGLNETLATPATAVPQPKVLSRELENNPKPSPLSNIQVQ